MRTAKVYVSIMGAENKQALTLNALQRAAGYLQSRIADRIETRYTPKLTFVMDKGVKHSLDVLKILNEVLPKDEDPRTPSISDEASREESSMNDDFEEMDEVDDDFSDDSDEDDTSPPTEKHKPR
ncbi:MAG: 30S ribosome-binding factor RbfA [Pirellulales bacterium]